jgi:hypothetical protein
MLESLGSGKNMTPETLREIKQQIRLLEKTEKTVKARINYKLVFLDLKRAAVRLAAPLIVSMISVISFFITPKNIRVAVAGIGFISFAYAVFVLARLLDVVIEMTRLDDKEKKDMNARLIEALSEAPEHTNVKHLKLKVDGKDLFDGREFHMTVNENRELRVEIENTEKTMAKNVTIGIKLPKEVTVEPRAYYSIVDNYVLYTAEYIHPESSMLHGPLVIRSSKEGSFPGEAHIKAENLQHQTVVKFSIHTSPALDTILEWMITG